MGLWGFHGDFRMDSKLRGNELNTAHFFVICFTGISLSKNNKNVSYKYNANTIDNYKMTNNNNHGLAKQ